MKIGTKVKYLGKVYQVINYLPGGFYFDWIANIKDDSGKIITIDDSCDIEKLPEY